MVKKSEFLGSIFFAIWLSGAGCKTGPKTEVYTDIQKQGISVNENAQDVFGYKYKPDGTFKLGSANDMEIGLWSYARLDTPFIYFGKFDNGFPDKQWQFILNDGRRLASNWNIYSNRITGCEFSLPFKYEETSFDSTSFRLSTKNDSLGKVSIIVGVSKSGLTQQRIATADLGIEEGLRNQGFTFTKIRHSIKQDSSIYTFTEFFMKDSMNNDVKLYHVYGNLPSKKHFVEFSMYHMGPNEAYVKPIYNLMVNHLYIDGERFYNPYLKP